MTFKQFHPIVRRLAARQHGVVTRAQLVAAGVPTHVIVRRLRAGALEVLHRGVYLASAVRPPFANEMAACLACGDQAALSHRSAGVLWRILDDQARPPLVEVALRRGFRRRPGIHTHQPARLRTREVTRHLRIPVTTPARTLLDLAAGFGAGRRLSSAELERAVAEAIALKLTTPAGLVRIAEQHKGNLGAGILSGLVAAGPALTRSPAETLFLDLVRRAGVEAPKVNYRLRSYEVDFFWPRAGLVVEIDGRAFHSSPRAFEADRRRDADLAAAGFRVIRVTWRQLTEEPEGVLFRLGRALGGGET